MNYFVPVLIRVERMDISYLLYAPILIIEAVPLEQVISLIYL